MHLHLYRDESRSGRFDLVGEPPWTVDLVTRRPQPSCGGLRRRSRHTLGPVGPRVGDR
jgi:hypothetical protein